MRELGWFWAWLYRFDRWTRQQPKPAWTRSEELRRRKILSLCLVSFSPLGSEVPEKFGARILSGFPEGMQGEYQLILDLSLKEAFKDEG